MTRPAAIATSGDDFDRRVEAARRRAEWELGDPSWAGVILAAFLDPDEDGAALREERDAGARR